MRIAVTGPMAADHPMACPGRAAADIAVGPGRLGLDPIPVGAAGSDVAAYGAWLRANGADTSSVQVSKGLHTARCVCTADTDQHRIAAFCAGAMAAAPRIALAAITARAGRPVPVLVAAR